MWLILTISLGYLCVWAIEGRRWPWDPRRRQWRRGRPCVSVVGLAERLTAATRQAVED